jgi:hypothetical protein
MARGVLAAGVSKTDGTKMPTEVSGDPVNNHQVANSGKTKILVRNSGAVARTVTFRLERTVDNQTVASKTKALPAGESWLFGPFDVSDYGQTLLIDVDNAELKLSAIE